MLRASIDAFLALRRAAGFKLRTEGQLLHNFAQWASNRGENHVRTITATEWAAMARNHWQQERRLRVVAGFARYARAEDSRHELPPICVLGRSQAASESLHLFFGRSAESPQCRIPARFNVDASTRDFYHADRAAGLNRMRISEALELRFG